MLALSAHDGDLSARLPTPANDGVAPSEPPASSLAHVRDWLDTSPDPVAWVDAAGAIRVTNHAFECLFEPGNLLERPALRSFVPLLGAAALQQLVADSEDTEGILQHHPLVLEGRIKGQQRALLCIAVQRLGKADPGAAMGACLVALRTVGTSASGAPRGPVAPEGVSLGTVLDAALKGLPPAQRRRCELAIDTPHTPLACELAPVRDALMMLLASACTRAPKSTRLRIIARQDTADGAPWAVITIADRGAGLRRRDVQRVFDSGRPPRHGISQDPYGATLRGARGLIESQDGWLELRSALGIGTEIDAWLPISEAAEPGHAPMLEEPEG